MAAIDQKYGDGAHGKEKVDAIAIGTENAVGRCIYFTACFNYRSPYYHGVLLDTHTFTGHFTITVAEEKKKSIMVFHPLPPETVKAVLRSEEREIIVPGLAYVEYIGDYNARPIEVKYHFNTNKNKTRRLLAKMEFSITFEVLSEVSRVVHNLERPRIKDL